MRSDPINPPRPKFRYRRGMPKPARSCAKAGKAGRAVKDDRLSVVDDLQLVMPVTAAELAVIETYLSVHLDALLATIGDGRNGQDMLLPRQQRQA